MRKLAVLTGKRGGFGALIPFFAIADNDPGTELFVIATDMHLSATFGNTLAEVRKSVRHVVPVPIDQHDGSPVERARALGRALSGIAGALREIGPDIFVVLGDRGETLSAVSAAVHLGIPVAHIQGGDISGNVDEVMRHAITKMSHLHFPSNEESAARIRRMGEEDWRIHAVGDPHIDRIVSGEYTPAAEVRSRYEIGSDERFVLVLFHPETLGDWRASGQSMRAIMAEVARVGLRALVVYPCSDQGYEGIVEVIEEYRSRPKITAYQNIEAQDFWGLQAEASALVGNSSAGLIEAPYFDLPVVNVGRRQEGRQRWLNVVDAPAEGAALRRALDQALGAQFRKSLRGRTDRPFGEGSACRSIFEVLKSVPLGDRLFNKRMTY
jgi:UDP-N-acetylglucosamine 2-epimerase (non-hydrolysing)/GDP/UDP-N,N'-diacetylbacillosamine 2-epimerase (hydrolysing)